MSDTDTLWLENQLCFALYAATNAITRSYRSVLEPLGLTYPQYLVLVSLLQRPSMTSGELARALKLDAGTLTPMLKRLSMAGLIERTRRPEDERVIDNQLTAKGIALQDSLLKAQRDVVYRTGLSNMALEKLRNTLQDLAGNLAHLPEDVLEPC
ncbi:MarR family winged helix-turn-helix transcriptional regulator [Acidisphaera sp. L21]|jgi:DNA-binding MarR family transcriptional regulator|uniref:MarR family winged helix-turn-helix transcriptional regulator n=1 Tax=Acidisphaera sp. L21 TaxID=1641851 RepID=UPI00131E06D1|nr:MarR family transcriptional regulator [Acidisphaera sp. L21]